MKTQGYPILSRTVCLRDFFDKTRDSSVIKSKEARYVIPYYQRPYEWEWKDKQLKGLINTFINLSYEKSDDDDEENQFKYVPDDYVVFGTIQINQNEKSKGYEIIDGQQRIVSFWILLTAIDDICGTKAEGILSFELENQISTKYQEQFDKFWESKEKNQYTDNYNAILCELKKIPDMAKLILLKDYILDRVLFSLMITSYEDDVDKTILLFNTLNTKGLDLGMKDNFKIKYFEFLKKNLMKTYSGDRAKKIFDEINSAYELSKGDELTPFFKKDEDTLIDTFKLWILMKDSDFRKIKLPERIKANNTAFFVDEKYPVWEKSLDREKDVRSLSTFSGLAKTIYQTQMVLQKMNNSLGENIDGLADPLLLCSDELLERCGYWYFRNLLYVFTHAIRMSKSEENSSELCEEDVSKALSLCMKIWKICSILKTSDDRVKNQYFTKITNSIVSAFVDNPGIDINVLKFKEILKEEPDYIAYFKGVIQGEKECESVFDNKRCRFFTILAYVRECKTSADLNEARRRVFRAEKKEERCEIEHIASKAVCKGTVLAPYVDQIGNLMLLNNGINSRLGTRTKTLENNSSLSFDEKLIQDFSGKIGNAGKGYWEEKREHHNVAVSKFLESVPEGCVNGSQTIDVNTILSIITERNIELQNYILNLYSDVI